MYDSILSFLKTLSDKDSWLVEYNTTQYLTVYNLIGLFINFTISQFHNLKFSLSEIAYEIY